MATTTVLHEPRLDTILMVEREIQKAKSYPTKKELWQSLPRKLQYQTFNRILDYLESSNKILLDKGEIVWTFPSNPRLRRLLKGSVRLRYRSSNIRISSRTLCGSRTSLVRRPPIGHSLTKECRSAVQLLTCCISRDY